MSFTPSSRRSHGGVPEVLFPHTQVTLAVLYAFWMPAGSAYNVDAVLEVMINGLREEIDERERAVDDAFAGRGEDARPGNPS